jgi:hypothetical protein
MWPSLLKIQYTEPKLLCGNDPVVKNYMYSNGDLDLWPNDPTINRVLPLWQRNHVAKFGKDPIYKTKVIVRKPVWTPTRPPAIPNHIIRPVSRRVHKKDKRTNNDLQNLTQKTKDRATRTPNKNVVLSLFQNKVTTENNHHWCITDY